MTELQKNALEALPQPLEDAVVTISNASFTYPAGLMLVGTLNLCPCGYHGDPAHQCTCTPHQVQRYISRLSGPLLDRVNISIEVPRLPYEEISASDKPESLAVIKKRVEAARERQRAKFRAENENQEG